MNATGATFAAWRDRWLAATLALFALASTRSWALDQSWRVAAWAGLGAGIVIGVTAGRLIAARLAFHGADGVLAAEALRPSARRRYRAAWHLVALTAVTIVTLVARPTLTIVAIPGYLLGALAGHCVAGLAFARLTAGQPAAGRAIRAWVRRPRAGIAAATILLVSLPLLARSLGAGALPAATGVQAAALALALTSVDDGIVRYLTGAGWSTWRVVAYHARGTSLFAGIATPVCGLALGPYAAGVIAAATCAMLLLMALRIMAYRLYPRRAADLVVSILTAILILVAVAMTIFLPLVAIAILWRLDRRAAAATWRIA